jgi:hypothetical protein
MDLYAETLENGSWIRLCGGGNGEDENTEACVEFIDLAGRDGAIAIRDSKNSQAGELRFTGAEMHAFVKDYATRHNITI